MAAAHSKPSLKCEVCTATVTLYSKFCATCGAKLDEETQVLKYCFNEGYEYEVIMCFFSQISQNRNEPANAQGEIKVTWPSTT